ncbi:iron chelate uptake ABC transporter family permease subunit (plasmid) [Falsirhodobacter algicola]|uniref:Iron chelate uptake ABC transporter family permease subunit n=2 Tax=Falsirhodobacter algicola TaxID=2692330 RepID=A0A8J8MVC9_9RHOB|nr:iron chelate uptake ABC transporter family permease subunit [Falsirhodobacter algicola]
MAGARAVPLSDYLAALSAYDPTNAAHVTALQIRLPRLAAGLVAGAALGVAGTVMQAITRNPLADPGILGVNAGAAFTLLLGGMLLGLPDAAGAALMTLPGAAAASALVFVLGGGLRGDAGPVRLTLAGAALNAMLLSLVSAIVLLRRDSLEMFRFWVVGSLSEAVARPMGAMALLAAAGGLAALTAAPRIEALSLGDALSRGLGTRPGRVQAAALLAVTLTTGAAVGLAGPIAFLGLVVPPMARRVAGAGLRAQLLAAAAIGATLLLTADSLGRLVVAPTEVRAGIMTALLGAPVFVWLARRVRPGAAR